MQAVGHELLKAHVLHARDTLGAQEVGLGSVAADLPFARVVHQELGDLTERAPFLAVVDDESVAALLGAADALLDAVGEVRPAGADVGAEYVRAIALVVHAAGERHVAFGEPLGVAEHVDRVSADGRQKDLEVAAGHELREHPAGLHEEVLP